MRNSFAFTRLGPISFSLCVVFNCAAANVLQTNGESQNRTRITYPATASPMPAFKRMHIGLCEDYPEESRSMALAKRDLQVLNTNDIRFLRIAFGWDAMEPVRGTYDWSFWDQFVSMATKEYGITLIPYVCYTPGWAASKPGKDAWRSPPREPVLFADFMRRIVDRYKGMIHTWELWNEPDNPHYWTGTTEEFAELIRAGSAAVRKADPSAQIVLGGLAWNLSFLKDLASEGALQNLDVVNLHNYYETWSDDPLERLQDYVGRASDILHNQNLKSPIWMAELGYSSYRSNRWVSGQYQARKEFEHTADHQAASLFRAMTLLLTSEKVELAAWYRINDLPGTQAVIGDVNNRHLGILGANGHPKASLFALAFFNRLFNEGYRNKGSQVSVRKALNSHVQTYAFQTPSAIVLIAWTPTRVPGDLAQTDSGDEPLRMVALELPRLENTPVLYDHTGKLKGVLPVIDVKEDRIRLTIMTDPEGVSVIVIPTNRDLSFERN